MDENKGLIGRVAPRRCPHCGHRQVGFVNEEGVFRGLKPGSLNQVFEGILELALVSSPSTFFEREKRTERHIEE
jgi:hypothetical protein